MFKNIEIKYGITRFSILIGNIAIKIPRIKKHLHFLQGCYSNYSERNFYKTFKNYTGEVKYQNYVAPSYFCSIFGLIQIQKRCIENKRELTDEEIKLFSSFGISEFKPCNYGYINSKLVVLDYA